MHSAKYLFIIALVLLGAVTPSCSRTGGDVWEDTKSSGKHMSRGFSTLCGKHGESRAGQSRDDFMPIDDECYTDATRSSEFVPLPDQQSGEDMVMAEYVAPQPTETPGEAGSSIPGINAFRDPATMP